MSWDNSGQWRAKDQWRTDDRLLEESSPGQLVLPVLAGLVSGLVVQLAFFTVVLGAALAVSDTGDDFGTGDALVWGTAGAIGLAVATGVCAWIIRRFAAARTVSTQKSQRAALLASVIFAAVIILLALTPALRFITLPVYIVLALAGPYVGSGRRRW